MAKLANRANDLGIPQPSYEVRRDNFDFENFFKRQNEALNKLIAQSDAFLAKGQVVGLVLSFPVADGLAYYLVVKEKPLTLQHVLFCDNYQIPYVMIRGIRKGDLEHLAVGVY